MSQKIYRFYCEYCHYNRWTDGTDIQDLVPFKRSPIQSAVPKLDKQTKKTVSKPFINLPKQFKCPGCGRLITAKKVKIDMNDDMNKQEGADGNSSQNNAS
jgi:hypothetical protein